LSNNTRYPVPSRGRQAHLPVSKCSPKSRVLGTSDIPDNMQKYSKTNKARKKILFFYNSFLDLIFPIECLNCGQEGVWLCKNCFHELKFKPEQYCLNCKKENEFGEFCSGCKQTYALNGVWIAGDYENKIIQALIKNLKYRFAKNISETLGKFLAVFLRNLINKTRLKQLDLGQGVPWRKFEKIKNAPKIFFNFQNSLIIPVPLHKKRLRWRGFNQAGTIAEIISKNFNLLLSSQLIRVKHKKPQAKLSEADRKTNIGGCFSWQGETLQNKNIILIDDVTTTGSTLEECAKILKKAGANEVWGLVVAKG